ncbi:hypothetical protein M2323_002673 [Rhodoblastus acidophilus]|nr:hypothetical protein [Rhodoblastus acidophilus]MCW2333739.1 hypothetical protein [Rhodoblastus acidophilus]
MSHATAHANGEALLFQQPFAAPLSQIQRAAT